MSHTTADGICLTIAGIKVCLNPSIDFMQYSKKVYLWAVTGALGGFLFGFDTAVISGAEQAIQHYWALNVFQQGLTVASALLGTILGAAFGSVPADKMGRKPALILIALLFLVSSICTAFSMSWLVFLIFRFIGGSAVGSSSVIAPIYISEISPAKIRGKLVGMFQFNVVLGILLAYVSNYFIGNYFADQHAWRFMMGVQAIPSVIFLVLLAFIPESPRWLIIKKGLVDKARNILTLINPAEMPTVLQAIQADTARIGRVSEKHSIWRRKYRFAVMLAMLIAFFNQFSGINAILYYAPRIFEMAGLRKNNALLSTIGIGMVIFIFTVVAVGLIDKVGRRKLMFIGTLGLIVSLGMISLSFFTHSADNWTIVLYMLVFMAFFALSQGTVIWVFISEIFPNEVRAQGQSVGSCTHWSMDALIAFLFPFFLIKVGAGTTFLFFTIMMVCQLIFVIKIMPETRGKSLEEIESYILK